jgi:hypothetical protein
MQVVRPPQAAARLGPARGAPQQPAQGRRRPGWMGAGGAWRRRVEGGAAHRRECPSMRSFGGYVGSAENAVLGPPVPPPPPPSSAPADCAPPLASADRSDPPPLRSYRVNEHEGGTLDWRHPYWRHPYWSHPYWSHPWSDLKITAIKRQP